MGRLLKYVFGGSSSAVAGDGYVYSASLPKSPLQSDQGNAISEFSSDPEQRSPNPARTRHEHSLTSNRVRLSGEYQVSENLGTMLPQSGPEIVESLVAFTDSVYPEAPESLNDLSWQDYEIPPELSLMKEDTPPEITNIVQESLDEQKAMKASKLHPGVAFVETPIGVVHEGDGPAIAESSAIASARSSTMSDRSWSMTGIPTGSDTSLEPDPDLDPGNDGLLKPPYTTSAGRPGNAPHLISKFRKSLDIDPQRSEIFGKKGRLTLKKLQDGKKKSRTSKSSREIEPATIECTSCFDDIDRKIAVRVPCQHYYCSQCFTQLISTSIEHESSFPPKCCLTDVPKSTIKENTSPTVYARYDKKALEYAIPIGNRYYCVSSECGKWIDTRHTKCKKDTLECPECQSQSCMLCRGPQHPSEQECPQDANLRKTLEQAERAGWRRCYRCHSFIEHSAGCNQMKCLCGAEFCYNCGARWRTCYCTWDDLKRRQAQITADLARKEREEEELRVANAAVEAAERRLLEEREAEEALLEEAAREFAEGEADRIHRITEYFEYLREALEQIRSHQMNMMKGRHDQLKLSIQNMRDHLNSSVKIAERETYVQLERDKIITSTDNTIKLLQRQHASSIIEMIIRHRQAQDEILNLNTGNETQDQDTQITTTATTLLSLLSSQTSSLLALQRHQSLELQKWHSRTTSSLQAFGAKNLTQTLYHAENEKISQREREVQKIVFADEKWAELVAEERKGMLREDEERLVRSGSEAPGLGGVGGWKVKGVGMGG